jgi:hypothetical protein
MAQLRRDAFMEEPAESWLKRSVSAGLLRYVALLLGNQKKWIFRKLMIDSGELREKRWR